MKRVKSQIKVQSTFCNYLIIYRINCALHLPRRKFVTTIIRIYHVVTKIQKCDDKELARDV